MNIETHFAEQLVKFQKKFELNTVYSNPYHTAFNGPGIIKLTDLVNETFADKYDKNKYIQLTPKDVADYSEDLFNIIAAAYKDKGGHFEFKTPQDIINTDLNYWIASDVDLDPNADLTIAGKTTNFGTKVTTIGQDGGSEAKRSVVTKLLSLMKTRGFYAEMDEELAIKFGLTPIEDESIISKVLAGKDVEFTGNGKYIRSISGVKPKEKVLVGIPKTK